MCVTVNTNVTFVSVSGGTIVPSFAITLSFVDDFIFIVYPLATVGIVSVVASCVGWVTLVILSASACTSACISPSVDLAGTTTSISPVSAVLPLDSCVTVNTNVTVSSVFGGIIVPSSFITLLLLDVFIAIVYPLDTDGIVNLVASFAGAGTLVIFATSLSNAACNSSSVDLAGTVTDSSFVSAVLPLDVCVTVNTNFTVVAVFGGIIVPSFFITLSLLDVFIAIVYPLDTDGIVNLVASFAGIGTLVIFAASLFTDVWLEELPPEDEPPPCEEPPLDELPPEELELGLFPLIVGELSPLTLLIVPLLSIVVPLELFVTVVILPPLVTFTWLAPDATVKLPISPLELFSILAPFLSLTFKLVIFP